MIALLTVSFSVSAQKNEKKVAFKSSVVCFMCKRTIEYDLTFEKGVKSVNVDLEKKLVEVLYNTKKTNPEELKKRLTQIGYSADELVADPKAYENLPGCCKIGDEVPHKNFEELDDHK